MNLSKFLPFTPKSNVGAHDTVLVRVPYCALIGTHIANAEIIGVEIKQIVVGDRLECFNYKAEYKVLYADEIGFLSEVTKFKDYDLHLQRSYSYRHSTPKPPNVGDRVWEPHAAFPSRYERL